VTGLAPAEEDHFAVLLQNRGEQGMNDVTVGLTNYPMARRGFVMTSLISGFTLATTVVEAQVIHTPATGLVAGEVQIPVADGHLPGYMARPEGNGPFPIVLVNEEIFGVTDWVKDICRRVAQWGYVAIAPEIYARIADLSKITAMSEIGAVVAKKPDTEVISDFNSTVAFAAQNHGEANNVGNIGFCRGGRNVWIYAASNPPGLKCGVAFYGVLDGERSTIQPKTALDLAGSGHVPMLLLDGTADAAIPVDHVKQAAAKAQAAGDVVEYHLYDGAPHGFVADYRPSYRADDAADALKRCQAWLKKYLG
jgi:carboxymethylenebutenolidase